MEPASLADALSAFQRGDLDEAARLGHHLLDSTPSPQVRHLLGLIDCRRGAVDEGIDHLAAAAAAEPDNPVFRLMLARALIDAGRADDALAMPLPPRDGAPASIALWHARAEAAAAEPPIAIEAWQVVAEARPSDWRAWSNLGNAHQAADQWPEARTAFARAVALQPGEARIRRNYAWALAIGGDLEASAAQLRAALAIDPDHLDTRTALARNLADLDRPGEALDAWSAAEAITARLPDAAKTQREILIGRGRALAALASFEAAERAYRAVLDEDPDNLEAISDLGELLERTGQMQALKTLLDAAADNGIGNDQLGYLRATVAMHERRPEEAAKLLDAVGRKPEPVRWHRLKAKIADAFGDSGAAFAEATAMHEAMNNVGSWKRKGEQFRRQIRSLAPVLTSEWTARLPHLPRSSRRTPVFLVGFPRSGTTLLDTFLLGHSQIAVLEEVPMLGAAERIAGKLAELPERSSALLEEARAAYFAEMDRHVDPAFEGIVIDKLPLNMISAPLINVLFPDALVIFAQRHPCDAVLSGFMQSFVLNEAMACFLDIEDAADLYDATLGVWSACTDVLPLTVHSLVYEQLVADPAGTLAPLVDELGLEWDEQMLDHRSTARDRGAISTPSYDQVTQPLSKAPVGRWRRYEKQLEPVLPVLLPWANRLGYGE